MESDTAMQTFFCVLWRRSTTLFTRYQKTYPWHTTTWPDPTAFARHGGVGYVAIAANHRVVAGCISAFIGTLLGDGADDAGNRKLHELDIFTVEKHRGMGLATRCAALVVRELLAAGLVPSWQCDSDNAASRRIGEKLGFVYLGDVGVFSYDPDI